MNIESPDFWIRHWREHNNSSTPFGHYSRVQTWNVMAKGYGRHTGGRDKNSQAREAASVLEKRIRDYLESIAEDGMVKSYMKGHTGRMIWSVKGKDSDNG